MLSLKARQIAERSRRLLQQQLEIHTEEMKQALERIAETETALNAVQRILDEEEET